MTQLETPAPEAMDLHAVAVAQRRVLQGLLANLVVNIAARTTTGALLLVALAATLAVVAYNVVWVIRLCRELGRKPWLYVVASFIPLVSLLAIAGLNSSATKFLKAHGVKVGLLGAKA